MVSRVRTMKIPMSVQKSRLGLSQAAFTSGGWSSQLL